MKTFFQKIQQNSGNTLEQNVSGDNKLDFESNKTWIMFTIEFFLSTGALARVFSCEFCQIFKNTFFTEHLWTTASTYSNKFWFDSISTQLTFYFYTFVIKHLLHCKKNEVFDYAFLQ